MVQVQLWVIALLLRLQSLIHKAYISYISFIDILSAALDGGVAVSSLLIYFILQYPKKGTIGLDTIQTWWGNTVYANTLDAKGVPKLTPDPAVGYFGPPPGHF